MNTEMMKENRKQGEQLPHNEMRHPCRGCLYVFTRGGTDCIMGAVPGDCAWYFYKRMMGHADAALPAKEIRNRYREFLQRKSGAEEKLERGIAMLIEVAELKYGSVYAQSLKRKFERDIDAKMKH